MPAAFFNYSLPFPASFFPGYSLVFRAGISQRAFVCVVLSDGAVSQVGQSIVQAVMVDVVADKVLRRIGYQSMHLDLLSPAAALYGSYGVCVHLVHLALPFELREPDVIFRIDLCEFALCQGDFAVIAEPVPVNGQAGPRPAVAVYAPLIGKAE